MSEVTRRSCPSSAIRSPLALAALTLALGFSIAAHAQTSGTLETLGGTGEPGYAEGAKGTSQFRNASALALRGTAELFIADTENDLVRSMRLSDTQTEKFAEAKRPVGLAFDSKTNLFVASQGDGTITKYDYFGHVRQTFRPSLTAGPMTALAIDRANNLYIAQQNGLIIRLNTNGFTDAAYQAPGGGPHDFRGVAVTDAGTIYVSDAAAHVIWRYNTNGTADLFAGTLYQPGPDLGEPGYGRLNNPQQIAVGPNGSIVIADRGNHQVRVASCEGIITVLWGRDWVTKGAMDDDYPGWYESTGIVWAEAREPVGVTADKGGTVYDTEVYYDLVRVGRGLGFPAACTTGGNQQTNTPPRIIIDPTSGFFPTGITITLTASNSASGFPREIRLFYTLTGISPTIEDTEIPISDDGKARLVLEGPIDLAKLRVRAFIGETGGVVTAAGATQVPTPVLSPDSGYYPMGVDVVVTSTNGFPAGTVLRYTTDGTVPTTNSLSVDHDGSQAVIGWPYAQRDLRSLKVKAFLGPNEGSVVGGRAVSFPGEPYQGEVGIIKERSASLRPETDSGPGSALFTSSRSWRTCGTINGCFRCSSTLN
jgi:hypothetical protein